MSDNALTVKGADGNTYTLRDVNHGSLHIQGILVAGLPDILPDLTGATLVYTVTPSTPVALVPPTAGAHYCRIRAWQAANDGGRLFFRKDGTAPSAGGSNAEGYMLHMEGMTVLIPTLTNFKMITETGLGNYTVYAEFLNRG